MGNEERDQSMYSCQIYVMWSKVKKIIRRTKFSEKHYVNEDIQNRLIDRTDFWGIKRLEKTLHTLEAGGLTPSQIKKIIISQKI